ncbi:MAG: uracil-DNA glycosylase family protein [Campylobacterota bacterium]|nr:uracil-DNA glycosylase family protein [Campylobacterota bacterium]
MFLHKHPHPPIFYENTKKIIMGTLPPPRFSTNDLKADDVFFPYGSRDSNLWRALSDTFDLNLVFENTQDAIKQRSDFLKRSHIGICDIVHSCEREKVDASDIGMSSVVLRDILAYLKEYKSVDTIVFTGGASKNGPEYFLRKILKEQKITMTLLQADIPKVHSFTFDGREIKTISLTSPSNAANRFIGSNAYYKEQKKLNPSYTTYDFRKEQYKLVFHSD